MIKLSRRALLSTAAAFALTPPAIGQVRPSIRPSDSFRGNPNVTIAAIDTSSGIACSRTGGQTPCFIQVSASAITAAGSDSPYEDLDYQWDFGDPSGQEFFSRPTDNARVNANFDQSGPEAAYCYRTPGTYTVKLTIKGRTGAGFTTTTVTKNIVVTEYAARGGEYWFDSVKGNDANDGLSSSKPKQSIIALASLLQVANRKFNFKRGSSWALTTRLNIASNTRFAAYGSGASPRFTMISSSSHSLIFMSNGAGGSSNPRPLDDVVISDVDLRTASMSTTFAVDLLMVNSNVGATVRNIYLDRCRLTSASKTADCVRMQRASSGPESSNWGLWGCSITGQLTPGSGNRHGFFGGAKNWQFFVGLTIVGAGSHSVLDHHIYPTVDNHGLFRWIGFGPGPERNYCINTNGDSDPRAVNYCEYHLIAECDMSGTQRAFDAGNSDNNPAKTRFRHFVVQNNAMHSLTGFGVITFSNAETMTVRDNLVWGCNGGCWWLPSPVLAGILTARIYRNRIYRSSGEAANLALSSATWTKAQVMTDNVIYDDRVRASAITVNFADHSASGSIIDRNQYYAPNDSNGRFLLDKTAEMTFAQWQAAGFDRNGRVANPNWPDPANGRFL